VAIASLAMIVVLSIFNGFSDLAEGQRSHLDPEIMIERTDERLIENGDSIAESVASWKEVEVAVPTLSERGLIVTPTAQMPVVFKGVGEGYDRLTDIDRVIIDGSFETDNTAGLPAMTVSVGVANALLTAPSATGLVNLYVPRREGRINPANPSAAFRGAEMVVSGVFRVNNADVDADNIVVPLEVARDLLARDFESSAVEVRCRTGVSPDELAGKISERLGPEYKGSTRLEQRAEAFKMIQIEKWVTFMMLIFILVITLFNVISTLSLLVLEKRGNMATLRAMGARQGMIKRIFVMEGFLVTAVGGIIGIVAGVAISLVQQYCRVIKLSADASALSIDYYPVRVSVADIALVAGVIVATGLIVGLITRLFVSDGRDKVSK
ncbi:MAG: FtsX-like permease family protein, partial [Muribaculaceae bacterium]|nr:FtsX-like permease family protein [Muribaculaceae bacterium]